MGVDCVVWNAHRIYGRHRLPLLLRGWRLLGFFDGNNFHTWSASFAAVERMHAILLAAEEQQAGGCGAQLQAARARSLYIYYKFILD